MEKVIQEDPSTTAIIHLNFAITALNHGDLDEAKKHFLIFDGQYHAIKESGGGNGESQFLYIPFVLVPQSVPLRSHFPEATHKRDILGALLLGR